MQQQPGGDHQRQDRENDAQNEGLLLTGVSISDLEDLLDGAVEVAAMAMASGREGSERPVWGQADALASATRSRPSFFAS